MWFVICTEIKRLRTDKRDDRDRRQKAAELLHPPGEQCHTVQLRLCIGMWLGNHSVSESTTHTTTT